MLDAYIGTTDYEDEGIDEALEEVGTFLDEDPSLDHSFVVVADEKLLSACLVTTWTDGNPFISYVMTDPNHKSGGLATACLLRSLESLLAAGETTVNAFITEGNTPSERLFARIGARRVG
jgi:RimJ/RimL family protein N-acetyltransferase